MIADLYTDAEQYGEPVIPGGNVDTGWEWPAAGLLMVPGEPSPEPCPGCGENHADTYTLTREDVPGIAVDLDTRDMAVALLLSFGPAYLFGAVNAFFDGMALDILEGKSTREVVDDLMGDPNRPDAITIRRTA